MAKKEKITSNVGTTLNTDGVIKAMAKASEAAGAPMSQKACQDSLNLLKGVIIDALATGAGVQLTGFLSLKPSYRAARKGNNVITGEAMDIPEGVVVNVKAGKSVKDATKNLDASVIAEIKKAQQKDAE